MVRRLLALAAAVIACLGLPAAVSGKTPYLLLEVVPDPAPLPYAQEMVLVTIRGLYKGNIVRERLETPDLPAFAWTQLGWDEWFDAVVDGRSVRVFERRMALFPKHSGSLTIPPFIHDIELMAGGAGRTRVAVRSLPVTLEVAPVPQADDWWLPARSLRVEERWEGTPEALGLGESAERIVTLEALGLSADRLPPMPVLRSPDVFAFPAAEERSVTLTPDGPVARVVWRWSLLPETPRPAVVRELHIGWFDTATRQHREVVLPARQIAVAAEALGRTPRRSSLDRISTLALPAGITLSLMLGLGIALPDLARRRQWRGGRFWALLRRRLNGLRLSKACRRSDVAAARKAARAVAGSHVADPEIAPLLLKFDNAAYGRPGRMPPDGLPDLANLLRCRLAASEEGRRPEIQKPSVEGAPA